MHPDRKHIRSCAWLRDGVGFSLVELSIVLVILGLLVGGILSGQSLIRASELRGITAQLQGFMAADKSFRDKYLALAGDMANATQFWGAAHANANVCGRTIGTGTQTCNGDGNGYLDVLGTGRHEPAHYWQHLALAGLIQGTYTGVAATFFTCCFYDTTNSPTGRLPNTLWYPYSSDGLGLGPETPFYYLFGAAQPTSAPAGSALRPEELWNIDTKLDDGMPRTGKVTAWSGTLPNNCVTGAATTDTYILTYTDLACYATFYTR